MIVYSNSRYEARNPKQVRIFEFQMTETESLEFGDFSF
jgi:hypothetical protein